MKFKVGDKVIPRKFSFESDGVIFNSDMNKYVGKEQIITGVRVFGTKKINLYQINKDFEWVEDSLELVNESLEPQKYFYVGQTVYSPLFQNKERKAVITRIDKSLDYPILCEGEDDVWMTFTLYGKHKKDDDYISLFQEPIQFPINKPIERFEEGEIVEVSDDGSQWILVYYKGVSSDKRRPYEIYFAKKNGEFTHTETYAKIRKIK